MPAVFDQECAVIDLFLISINFFTLWFTFFFRFFRLRLPLFLVSCFLSQLLLLPLCFFFLPFVFLLILNFDSPVDPFDLLLFKLKLFYLFIKFLLYHSNLFLLLIDLYLESIESIGKFLRLIVLFLFLNNLLDFFNKVLYIFLDALYFISDLLFIIKVSCSCL